MLEADFLRFYNIDLPRDIGTERLSYRRILVLASNLPREAMYWMATDPAYSQWGSTEMLLARAVEALEAANWQRQGDDKAKRPPRIIRPGVLDEEELKKKKIEERLAARGIIIKER